MKFMPFILALVVVIWGCDNKSRELQNQLTDLQNRYGTLQQELNARDEYVDTVTQSINDIYNNLEGLRAQEKLILKKSNEMETGKKMGRQEIRQSLLNEISTIDSTLKSNRARIGTLQTRMNSYRSRYAGLQTMVESLKKTIGEREQSIAELELKVKGLESDLSEKTRLVGVKDSVINDQATLIRSQHSRIITGYYVVGSRKELESKGLIAREGGFLWGLLGSTTVLGNGASDETLFRPIDKSSDSTIQVNGSIDEIVPKRDPLLYSKMDLGNNRTQLTIREPRDFWRENYLVIITD